MRASPPRRFIDYAGRAQRERQRDAEAVQERRRIEEERLRIAEQQRIAEQRGLADEAERRRQKRGNKSHVDTSNRRLAGLEREWAVFKSNVIAAERRAQQAQQYQKVLQTFDEMIAANNPPPEPEVEYIYPDEGSDRMGDPDFNPRLWNRALRWW